MTFEIVLVIILTIQFMIMMKYYSSCCKKLNKFLFGFSSGVLTLYPTIYVISHFGGQLSFNIFTVTVASILGMPGTLLLAIASII